MQNLKALLILCNQEGKISFEKRPEGIHANHVLKHRNNGEIPGDHSVNRPAYINHIHDRSSRERNPSRCHSQAEKSNSLDFTGLKIPRDYIYDMEVTSEHDIPLIVKRIVDAGGDVYHVSKEQLSLEKIYFSLIDREHAETECERYE